MKKSTKNISFLDRYDVGRRLFQADKYGRPSIWEATDATGSTVLIRQWPRKKSINDEDIEDIWRSEIRQLHSLSALPNATDLIAEIRATGKDEGGFYLVVNGGDDTPLETWMSAPKKPATLTSHRLPSVRNLLWRNFRRIIEGVELLHSQGTIHRNLDPWAILTSFSPTPDFRLTGFEWSMRIVKTADTKKNNNRLAPRTRSTSSFLGDWADLALVIATVLEIPPEKLVDMSLIPSAVTDHTTAAEVKLLRTMMGLIPVDRLDGDRILEQLDPVVTSYAAEASRKDAHLHVALHLGPGSKLTDKIRSASSKTIDVAETSKQIDFIADDLGEVAQLVCLKSEFGQYSYQICGTLLNYKIQPWKQPFSTEVETWEFALCEDADPDAPLHWNIVGSQSIDLASLDFADRRDARQSFPRLRGKTLSWEEPIGRLQGVALRKTEEQQAHQAMVLLFFVELAYAAADIFPVRVSTNASDAQQGDTYRIKVRSEVDESRLKLAKALRLPPPAKRLSQIIESGDLRERNAWMLLEDGELGETLEMTQWRLVETEEGEDGHFELEGSKPPQLTGFAYLTQGQAGTIVQLKRRLRALLELSKHAELLKMLTDPRGRIDDSQDKLDKNDTQFGSLDASKQAALEDIFSTIPLFLLQGPPGVGKTYVVSEIVRRRLKDESTSRFLLTAQSNAAIDHLMDEIIPLLKDNNDVPLVVRARSLEDDRQVEGVETEYLAANIVREMFKSPLFNEGSQIVRERIKVLSHEYDGKKDGVRSRKRGRTSTDKRAIESMILRSANLVFATTNSAAVETLIQDRGLFDWTIVEEAAKATGSELISPLLLSYRRLMIGDHKQLPPFDSERVEALLADPSAVGEAIKEAQDMISRQLKDQSLDELFDDVKSGSNDFPSTCALALSYLKLFGSFVEDDYKFIANRPHLRPIARRLSEQHRMHPAISKIVSHCFYDDTLKNYAKKEHEFRHEPSPVSFLLGKRDTPVSFIKTPYCRLSPRNSHHADCKPNWQNPLEIQAVLSVLSGLKVNNSSTKRPTLAILSPYTEQVISLKGAVRRASDSGKINLSGFSPAIGGSDFCGTVDSFQGGQADCVVVSLVRNNEHTNPGKALGFLTKSHRMNVLLSRAKWRLILVGSLDFYQYVLSHEDIPGTELSFFRKFYGSVVDGPKDDVEIVDYSDMDATL